MKPTKTTKKGKERERTKHKTKKEEIRLETEGTKRPKVH